MKKDQVTREELTIAFNRATKKMAKVRIEIGPDFRKKIEAAFPSKSPQAKMNASKLRYALFKATSHKKYHEMIRRFLVAQDIIREIPQLKKADAEIRKQDT